MVYAREPGRFTLPGFGGRGGPPPRDVLVLLGVVFATFSLQFFAATAPVVGLLRLTPEVWQRGFLWQLATYPLAGFGPPSLWFLLELLILFWFGRDVYAQLGPRRFRKVLAFGAIGAGVAATLVHLAASPIGWDGPLPFSLMQGQRMLIVILVAAFATLNRDATIYFMFVLPLRARWFLWLEILFAFLGFLGTHDLPGFLGICAAVGLTYFYLATGGGKRGFRESRLKLERWWIQQKLERNRRKRGLRVVPGDRGKDVRRGPWVN
jgi:hypothetical protein